jgi:hypothetical protein
MPEGARVVDRRRHELRGTPLLLEHCERIDRLTAGTRPSARARLAAQVGEELARTLLGALCGPMRVTGRG